jgi:hypothetical protein
MDNYKTFKIIYDEVFSNTFSQSYYVFLCGGAGKNHIRNQICTLLEKDNYQVFYPEDLFIDMLNRNKKSDLLDFENLLARNSDMICVICESMGSAVELGAFVQNADIQKKMVAAIEQRFSRNKSFINLGPLKYLSKINKNSILYYKKGELDNFVKQLETNFDKINRKDKKRLKTLSFDNLSAYIAFIPMIIWFYGTIERKVLFHNIKELLTKGKKYPFSYNELFNASIKYLVKVRTVVVDYNIEVNEESYSLSERGYYNTEYVLNKSISINRTKLHDKIRCGILREQLIK